jgi:signal transduction histidine kinase/CheY-like chemotaxis protein/HPt (histidine-containing phosphotransfer) domain-containing protein
MKKVITWYKKNFVLPDAIKKKVAIANAKAAIFVFVPLFLFAVVNLMFSPIVVGVLVREIYFGGLAFLSLVGACHALLVMTVDKSPHIIRDSVGIYAMVVAMAFSVYDMFTSSEMVNGLLVLAITCLLTIVIIRVEPTVFTAFIIIVAIIMLPRLYNEYGSDLFLDAILIFVICILLAYLERKRFIRSKRQEQRLIFATRKAREADRAKSSFLARMSHEIRSPINAVLGLDEMIMRETKEDGTREYAKQIQSSSRTLLSVINDVLDFSRIESGKMELYPVEFDTPTILNDLYNMIVPRGEDKGLEMILNVNPDLPNVLYGDEVRIRQVMLNILTNAVKYTDHGSVTTDIDFSKVDEDHVNISIKVTDTGRGIREEDMAALINPYTRLDEQQNLNIEGTGLGISICLQLLKLMNSELKVDSVYGQGSCFYFDLLLEVRDWSPISDFSGTIKQQAAERVSRDVYRVSFNAPQAKVLAVDDIPINLTVFTSLLKETKMQIDTALSGIDCLAKAAQTKYDIIFLDHMMPDMDGMETMYRLRTDDDMDYKETPIIVVTANAISGMRENYLREGFTDYISKPIDTAKLERMIIQYLPKEKVTICEDAVADPKHEVTAEDFIYDIVREGGEFECEEAAGLLGGSELYAKVFREFSDTVGYRSERIEKLLSAGDIHNFTIEVHALKSAARMIGAMSLSEHAKTLEECGKNGEIGIIFSGASELLTEYRGLGEKMTAILESAEERFRKLRGIEEKPFMQEAEVADGLRVISEAVEVFDYDVAKAVMDSFAEHELPESFGPTYKKLKVGMAEVARESILNIVSEYLKELNEE